MHVFVYECKTISGLLQHGRPSISAPKSNLHGTIYDVEFTISGQLLTAETAAEKSMMKQTHLVVSRHNLDNLI